MTATKRCPYCDTTLEFESGGQRLVFTAHDDAFCFAGTKERVRMLEQALVDQRATFERHAAGWRRQIDALLTGHGLPTLDDRARARDSESVYARALAMPVEIRGAGS